MKLKLFTVIALLTLICGLTLRGPMAVAAQDEGTPSADSDLDLSNLDGLKSAVGRSYVGDVDAMMSALIPSGTPGADASTPDLSSLGLFSLTGVVAEFEKTSQAKDGFDKATDEITKSLESDDSEDAIKLEDAKVSGVGDQSKAFTGTMDEGGIPLNVFVITAQQDNFIYVGVGITFADDAKDGTSDFTKAMIDGKAGKGDGTFSEDGKSTGGLWDKFPTDGDKVLQGLTVSADELLYPQQEGGE
ncbi:MAG TPA: hypothetical protein VFQ54_07885 [Thermomicrobiales bacterium]|nr:hypothetical protein [Thermomicrobiales bacterium]